MQVEFIHSINAVSADQWDRLWQTDYPFVQHGFLQTLESSGCTQAQSGWQPYHAVVWHESQLVGAMLLYLKSHSYGEYVFDWSWADAYQQHGLPYYPKLVNAIPFTPATGPRWAAEAINRPAILDALFTGLAEQLQRGAISSWHCLFPEPAHNPEALTSSLNHQRRLGCQYHWFNQDFKDFDHFLESFNARKRKSLKRERRKVTEQEINVERALGDQLTEKDWLGFYRLYRRTYLKRSGHTGYLNARFFLELGQQLAGQILMVKAYQHGHWVAAALYLFDQHTLYGRYWGAQSEFDGLHFECCYYQGIEFAIERGLQRFDPGAQGEHKIQRGFTPILTQSFHSIGHPGFAQAVEVFLQEERQHIELYCQQARDDLPFKIDTPLKPLHSLTGDWSSLD